MTRTAPAPTSDGWLILSWIAFGFACLSLLAYPIAVYVRGRAIGVFEDFDIELPVLTIKALSIPAAALLALPLILIAVMLAAQLALPRKELAASFHLCVILLSTCFGGFLVVALWLPMMKLLQSVA